MSLCSNNEISISIAGDAIITRKLSAIDSRAFRDLQSWIQRADIGLINVESTVHDYEGYPTAKHGDMPICSPP